MTCIIALRCNDGIVLIADRKVRYPNGNVISKEKIFCDYTPFVIASSGNTMPFDDFRKKALELAQKSLRMYKNDKELKTMSFDPTNVSGRVQTYPSPTTYPVLLSNPYLKGIRDIVRDKIEESRRNRDLYEFDVLVAFQTYDVGMSHAHLYYIDDNGVLNGITSEPYVIIGSSSAQHYGSIFIKPSSRTLRNISEFGEVAYFTIKYIDRFKMDDTIGLEGEKPLVYIVPHNGDVGKAPDSCIQKWEVNTNKMLDNYEKQGIHKLL